MKAPKGSAAMSEWPMQQLQLSFCGGCPQVHIRRFVSPGIPWGNGHHIGQHGRRGSGNYGTDRHGSEPRICSSCRVLLWGGYGILPGFIAGYAIGFIAPFIEKHLPPGLDSVLGASTRLQPIARFIAFLVDPAVNAALAHIGGMISVATEQSPILMGLLLGGLSR